MTGEARVAIIGGGLAGLATAVSLRAHGCEVELFEARGRLGGRASSFRDATTGQLIDYCQHVSMGCCTNLADFCRRVGIDDQYQRERRLHFFDPQGRRFDIAASRYLPAPLHLGPSLWRLKYLSVKERLRIATAIWRLSRYCKPDSESEPTINFWLKQQGQTDHAIEYFWEVLLVSALGETLDRISIPAARKILVDGFLAARSACEVVIPRLPLGQLYGERLEAGFSQAGVSVRLSTPVRAVQQVEGRFMVSTSDGEPESYSQLVVALPWRQCSKLLEHDNFSSIKHLRDAARFESSPITGIHLWFDRPPCDVQHAVLVGRMSHWLFARGLSPVPGLADRQGHYYQVVNSASRHLAGREQDQIVQQVCNELGATFAAAREAVLLHAQIVTEKAAVFSPLPGIEQRRPAQRTDIPGLYLAGDWTDTHWPATMESAVRSGYLAASALLQDTGSPVDLLVPDLPRGWLARWLLPKH
jgi:squalene-associated FAD-dependent desaturase